MQLEEGYTMKVIIIGAGIIGSTAAYKLSKQTKYFIYFIIQAISLQRCRKVKTFLSTLLRTLHSMNIAIKIALKIALKIAMKIAMKTAVETAVESAMKTEV